MSKLKTNDVTIEYKELSQELVAILTGLEQGELMVDEAVQSYARGLEVITILENQLLQAENKVITLKAQAASFDENEEE